MRRVWITVLALLALATVAVAGVALRSPTPPPYTLPAGYQLGRPVPQPPAALMVGDSFAEGTGATVGGGFAPQVCSQMGWTCNVEAEGGTGFVNNGHTGEGADPTKASYGARLQADKGRYLADVAIVTGGRNDLSVPGDPVTAATEYLHALHAAYPQAKLVVVAPFWNDADPPAQLLNMRDAEKSTAAELGATFIDPLADGWTLRPDQLVADGVHPNQAGHDELARRLVAALRQQHVTV